MIGAVGAAFAYSVDYSYYKGFAFTVVAQLLVYNLFKYMRDGYMTVRMREIEMEEIKSFEKQGMDLECAHCRDVAYVPIRFDQQNVFECPACGKTNSVYLNVTVARETTPLNTEAVTTRLLIDEEERVKQSIRESNDTNE